jgi:hypothetical protein
MLITSNKTSGLLNKNCPFLNQLFGELGQLLFVIFLNIQKRGKYVPKIKFCSQNMKMKKAA